QYVFVPTASDPNGDALTFSISNRPSWASFDPSSGTLSGTPGPGDIGSYNGIRISVSDGTASASLAVFGIQVVATATGSALVSCTPRTLRDDGSPLTDLAGYKVYWGTSERDYPNSVTIDNPGITSYMVEELT